MTTRLPLCALAACCLALALPLAAQAEALSVRLNALQPQPAACRLVFALDNGLEADIEELAAEIVVLDQGGRVERLTLLDFQNLPAGRPRIRSFDLPALDCAEIGSLLLNGFAACTGEGLSPRRCEQVLVPGSDIDGIEVRG